ncbi:DinB family protein [Lysinibacter cavernae]|uniref:DinB-like domain-containing protein n=1 Tax=Lysinibacter cavernae TaxID=1640652 RepID=A0A7X5TVF4_9MICO|nr:DinB family protein [Lysinibacter cavernae]NIH54982.1 hypothetical protein [Lysinibacter cavernae]
MGIEPDNKDWTWVITEPCGECGLDAASLAYEDIPASILDTITPWDAVLASPAVRDRPNASTWSPLEYAAHVRDVHRIFAQRLALMIAEDEPTFANWNPDETAESERYAEQEPAVVLAELSTAGRAAAEAFAKVPEEDRGRKGFRSNGSVFTVDTLARYYLHDAVHHVHDVAP